MPALKAKELRSLSTDELRDKAEGFRKELFQMRFDLKMGKLNNPSKIRQVRRDLAKALTLVREMELKKNVKS